MSNLTVQDIDGILLVDSRLIADRLEIEHESFIKTLDTYQPQIEQAFGILRFEIGKNKGRGRPSRYALLSEDQATFVMTLSRNTPEVVQCKLDLVQAFSRAKQSLQAQGSLQTPQTYIEALKALVASEERKQLLEAEKKLLEEENEQLAEVVDELFDYSSIIRVAKFNHCDEKAFNWRQLKAASDLMGVEVKKVPCPRFGTKNLYSHDAWRYVYPQYRLPETTTIRVVKSQG